MMDRLRCVMWSFVLNMLCCSVWEVCLMTYNEEGVVEIPQNFMEFGSCHTA